ncbi:hypothetical protein GAMM_200024 [Gammaproteobacteria bacterium]
MFCENNNLFSCDKDGFIKIYTNIKVDTNITQTLYKYDTSLFITNTNIAQI